jgi:hypothetical protein
LSAAPLPDDESALIDERVLDVMKRAMTPMGDVTAVLPAAI